ncbi:MAG: NADH-quinone oxidoreductase subunit J [Candidatus Aminicenantes bacterium]|nr:NADH-quinone oxidoreductase subunit J [Candidatus Aminicenantes bacterium]
MAWIVFTALSLVCVGAVAAMIVSRAPAHNALFLVLAFASLGGLFGLLDAPFAAAVQVLVYAGAIMVLFLFALMMFDLRSPAAPRSGRLRTAVVAALALVLLAETGLALVRLFGASLGPAAGAGRDLAGLGRLLFTDHLYALELTSVLILAALVGALALAGTREEK